VRSLLTKLRRERASQRSRDTETFSGMFGRGEIYDRKSLEQQKEREAAEKKAAEKPRSVEDCEREAREADEVVKSLHAQGKRQDAEQLERKINEHRQQLGAYKEAQTESEARKTRLDPRNIDFRNPTPEQVEDAKKHGIDLFDPLVVNELERLQDAQEKQERKPRHRRRPPPPDVGKIPLHEIRRRLDGMGVAYTGCDDRPSLEQKLLAQYHSPAEDVDYDLGELNDDDAREGGGWFSSWGGSWCVIS